MTKPSGYSATQIGLHWIVVLLIVLQYVLHDGISAAWEAVEEGREAASGLLVPMHILGGVLIAVLALWRLALRARRGTPLPPAGAHPALDLVARVTHGALYLLMLLLPLTGALAWFGGVETAAGIHVVLTTLLLVLAGLHVAAALFHHFVMKDGLLNRMGRPAS